MPDPELIAYLDGEADPATARLLEARLVAEPEVRQQLLLLMRQRVALTRVLMGVAPVAVPARSTQRWWLLAAAGLAAASIVLAITIARPGSLAPTAPARSEQATTPRPAPRGPAPPDIPTQAPPAPSPQRDPVSVSDVRLADGSVLPSGTVIEAGPDQPLERRLSDGTVFVLAASSALEVPAAGAPWRLRRGIVTCELPAGVRAGRDGVATAQAVVEASGRLLLSMTADGTQLRLLAGEASARDALTAETTRLRAGMEAWIPIDDMAPRHDEVSAGVARGTVVEVGPQGRSLVLRTRFGSVSFVPEWLVQPPGHDPAMCARLARLRPGDRVAITWRSQEHLRVQEVRLITAAPRQEEPPPPVLDF